MLCIRHLPWIARYIYTYERIYHNTFCGAHNTLYPYKHEILKSSLRLYQIQIIRRNCAYDIHFMHTFRFVYNRHHLTPHNQTLSNRMVFCRFSPFPTFSLLSTWHIQFQMKKKFKWEIVFQMEIFMRFSFVFIDSMKLTPKSYF